MEERQTYFSEVEMQCKCKFLAAGFNRLNPPKKIDFVQPCVLELLLMMGPNGKPVLMGVAPFLRGVLGVLLPPDGSCTSFDLPAFVAAGRPARSTQVGRDDPSSVGHVYACWFLCPASGHHPEAHRCKYVLSTCSVEPFGTNLCVTTQFLFTKVCKCGFCFALDVMVSQRRNFKRTKEVQRGSNSAELGCVVLCESV